MVTYSPAFHPSDVGHEGEESAKVKGETDQAHLESYEGCLDNWVSQSRVQEGDEEGPWAEGHQEPHGRGE